MKDHFRSLFFFKVGPEMVGSQSIIKNQEDVHDQSLLKVMHTVVPVKRFLQVRSASQEESPATTELSSWHLIMKNDRHIDHRPQTGTCIHNS